MRVHLIVIVYLMTGISVAQTPSGQIVPTVTTARAEDGSVTVLHLAPGYATSVRLPEEISSVVIGNPRWACRRFARGMGVKSRRPYRTWTAPEQQRLLKLIDLYPINEVAKMMRRSQSSIWHMLYRLGANAKMGKDSFTKYTLAVALHVRPDTVESWINRRWLKATAIETGRSKRVVIQAEDFCEFCRQHTKDVVGNRLTQERLDFVYHFAFPPSHWGLLPVRNAKKEQRAYEAQLSEADNQDASTRLEDKASGAGSGEMDAKSDGNARNSPSPA